ncbi:unnamed protein product [Lepeophtheirus salmonis]|uniref:(salmon louse) hypothetical protein n=1 Tax=Lepeophtheirus salmonis TaxID=72036 RepID=A0A7R8CEE9_LEPSM|nr:unnamed protein product [Lepeophtheirus salmonis]CAF2790474.1 unnamed protein product [Lepeophtheirus salmonis]
MHILRTLQKRGLVFKKDSNRKHSFQTFATKVNLIPKSQESVSLTEPSDPSYVFNGAYTPLISRIVESFMGKGNQTESKFVLIYFIGGYTLAEVASLKILQTIMGHHFVIAGTSNTTGKKIMESLSNSTRHLYEDKVLFSHQECNVSGFSLSPPSCRFLQKVRKNMGIHQKLELSAPTKRKCKITWTIIFSLFGAAAFSLLLFLVPFIVDPALATILADFTTQNVSCVVTELAFRQGQGNCSWSSCREGCTRDVYTCFQIHVNYTDLSAQLQSGHLFVNARGCGLSSFC